MDVEIVCLWIIILPVDMPDGYSVAGIDNDAEVMRPSTPWSHWNEWEPPLDEIAVAGHHA